MPDLDWNRAMWGSAYAWTALGEEWSHSWGGSEAQWFGTLYPRLHRFLPARRILEIAPGYGRWSKYLIPNCDEFLGIDLAEKCVHGCREIFASATHARFVTNDGQTLTAAPDGSFDFVFSFDSLVHADYDVMASYVPEVLRKLAPGGVAFLHHSNLLAFGGAIGGQHGRSMSVSAQVMADLIRHRGGAVLVQEVVNWGGDQLIDCLSLFGRRDDYPAANPVQLQNRMFMAESTLIHHFQSPYSKLESARKQALAAAE
ncbi:MAG: class I SAM-dependent methyltransferase [Pseudolabrys sp.]